MTRLASGYTAMIGEADIWSSAAQIIKRYGDRRAIMGNYSRDRR